MKPPFFGCRFEAGGYSRCNSCSLNSIDFQKVSAGALKLHLPPLAGGSYLAFFEVSSLKSRHPISKNKNPQNKKLAANSPISVSSSPSNHRPVLLAELTELLKPFVDRSINYLDLTAGGGGHAAAVAKAISSVNMTLVDRDPAACLALRSRWPNPDVTIHNGWSADLLQTRPPLRGQVDFLLADLGWSLDQVLDSQRGFSFGRDGRLDMRYDQSLGQPLVERLDQVSQTELERYLREYGQEPKARMLATAIKQHQPQTTLELAELVVNVKGSSRQRRRIHPATRVFQALRMWVNDEIRQLEILLREAPDWLSPGGIAGVISFHSVEDRLVKQAWAELSQPGYDCRFHLLSTKPISPSPDEIAINPAARSAKLRLLVRNSDTKNKQNQKQKG